MDELSQSFPDAVSCGQRMIILQMDFPVPTLPEMPIQSNYGDVVICTNFQPASALGGVLYQAPFRMY